MTESIQGSTMLILSGLVITMTQTNNHEQVKVQFQHTHEGMTTKINLYSHSETEVAALTELINLFQRLKGEGGLTLDQYQASAMRTAGDSPYPDDLLLTALGLTGEGGEFADMVKKLVYHDTPLDRDKAIKELGDVLWYVARGCMALGVTLGDVAERNLTKLLVRYPDQFDPQRSQTKNEEVE
jgi:NTP pyrophosphatase (non-canonical NTP hydrolase)